MPHCDWVLIDAGDVIVHVFRPEVRAFYNIVEFANLGAEDVNDHVACVDQHPVAVRHALDPRSARRPP